MSRAQTGQQPSAIIGAGLAGLIAAHAFPGAKVLEANPPGDGAHKAVLRFRTDKVARLTGLDFRAVTVRKGIWFRGDYVRPNIAHANHYERKVLGPAAPLKGDRSIWNLEAAARFVAPEDFHAQLLGQVRDRVHYNTAYDFEGRDPTQAPIINTAPLPVVMRSVNPDSAAEQLRALVFRRAAIRVRRFMLAAADLFQTAYFPDPDLAVYRASITGNMLIVELTEEAPPGDPADAASLEAVARAFGLGGELALTAELPATTQRYGKIAPMPESTRKQLLFDLTHNYGIYSLGRFATWRNILLDDVVDDIAVIKRLLRSASAYDLRRSNAS